MKAIYLKDIQGGIDSWLLDHLVPQKQNHVLSFFNFFATMEFVLQRGDETGSSECQTTHKAPC